MHKLTQMITERISINQCDYDNLDDIITYWATEQMRWLDEGAHSVKRIRKAIGAENGKLDGNPR